MSQWGQGWEMQNTVTDIRTFFDNTEGMPLRDGEFKEFWLSLSEKEREEFRKTKLQPTPGP